MLAFTVACVSHEAIGHGGACVLSGGKVTQLTSVYFHCHPGTPFVDAAGPSMNIVVAFAAYILQGKRFASTPWSVFVALVLAFNSMWGAGYFIFSSVLNTGDWALFMRNLGAYPTWLWRVGMGVIGVFLYRGSIMIVTPRLPPGMPTALAYASAGFIAALSVVFYTGPFLPAFREAIQESLLASLGLLVVAFGSRVRQRSRSPFVTTSKVSTLLLFTAFVLSAFFFTLGRGYAVT